MAVFLRAVLVLLVGNCVFSPIAAKDEFTKLKNNGIHTFQNRHDMGFLTAINLRTHEAPIVTDIWRDAPTQKWRAKSALMSNSYELFPIVNEGRVMNYDTSKRIVFQDSPGLGLSNTQYWQMLYVGHGYHVIKSYKNGRCLESQGLGNPVGVAECTSIPRQQWAIHNL